MTDAQRLAEIGARCERATEGPWKAQEFPCMDYYSVTGPDGLFAEEVVCHDRAEERIIVRRPDADFIAHAREDVPWLLRQLGEVRESAAQWGRLCARLHGRLAGIRHVVEQQTEFLRTGCDIQPSKAQDRAKVLISMGRRALAADAGKPEADVIAAAKRYEDANRELWELDRNDPWFGHCREIGIEDKVKAGKDLYEAVVRMREGSGGATEVPEEGGGE